LSGDGFYIQELQSRFLTPVGKRQVERMLYRYTNYIFTSLMCEFVFSWEPWKLYGALEYYQELYVVAWSMGSEPCLQQRVASILCLRASGMDVGFAYLLEVTADSVERGSKLSNLAHDFPRVIVDNLK